MTTVEERVAFLEQRVPMLATKRDLTDLEHRLESRIYTSDGHVKGYADSLDRLINVRLDSLESKMDAMDAKFEAKFAQVLEKLDEHRA